MPNQVERANPYNRRGGRSGPMGDMNVTPFIDVLLVLIIMLIMVVPVGTHETEVDLPGGSTGVANSDQNTLYINANDELFWNGIRVDRSQLRANIKAASLLDEEPILRFEPAALASYDQASRTIALIKDSGAERFAFIGNAQHKDFGR